VKLLDKYIIGKFLGTFFLTLALLLSIAVVIDLSENIDEFLAKGAPLKEIAIDHYLNFMAFYGTLFSSMVVFLATIFFTSRMANQTETVAILTGGVSFTRFLVPYFISAGIIAMLSLLFSHLIIPKTNVKRLAFEYRYIYDKTKDLYQNIHRQVRPGTFIFLENYSTVRKTGYHFTLEQFEGEKLVYKLSSDFIKLDTSSGRWILDNYKERILPDSTEIIRYGRRLDTIMPFKEEELTPFLFTAEMMTTPELLTFIEGERLRGSENMNFYLLEKHKRSTWPIANFILVMIGATLSSRKKRGGLGINLALGLVICVVYIFFMQVTVTFATVGDIPPALAMWLPNIIFTGLAIYLYRIAPK
jgi:lipopolysaccharide export system permease protein